MVIAPIISLHHGMCNTEYNPANRLSKISAGGKNIQKVLFNQNPPLSKKSVDKAMAIRHPDPQYVIKNGNYSS
jgi:hypothetical protein